jgi:hypothetical protein
MAIFLCAQAVYDKATQFCYAAKKRAKAAPASASEQLINMVINFSMLLFRRFFVVIYSNSLRVTERLLVPESGYFPTNS